MRQLIAVVPLGLERLAAREIRTLGGGVGKTKVEPGRVSFEGPPDALYRANLWLRIAERILLPVAYGPAREFEQLADLVRGVDWAQHLPQKLPLRFSISAKGCRLYHTGAIEERLRDALNRAGHRLDAPAEDYKGPYATLDVRGTRDHWLVAVDTTGRGLHRRSYRKRTAKAPIRENLAAALLFATGYTGDVPFLDPTCGAGTIAIEAALLARKRAPGLDRPFLFEQMPSFDAARWRQLVEDARRTESTDHPPLEAADAVSGAVRASKDNAQRAGVLDRLTITRRSLEDTPSAEGGGLIVCNPPFGKRVEAGPDTLAAYAKWGDTLRQRRPGWRILMLATGRKEGHAAGARSKPLIRFLHGGIEVGLYEIASG